MSNRRVGAARIAPPETAPGGRSSSPVRVAGLDGIRTVAVTVVLLVHADLMPGGFIGVDLFFVLSGFLITSLMLTEIASTGRLDLMGFWLRRGFRLVPAVTAYLAAGILVALVTKPEVARQVTVNAVAVLAGLFNYLFPVLGGNTAWDGHLWSLSVEAQFYVFWPLVLIIGLRHLSERALLVAGVAGMATLAAWRAAVGLALIPGHTDWYHSTDSRVDGFVAGAVLALALHVGVAHAHSVRTRRFWAVGAPLGWAVLLLACMVSPRLQDDPRWAYTGGLTVVTFACAAIVGATILRPDLALSRVLAARPMAYVGRISYAFYLWHFPVVFGLEPVLDPHVGRWGTALVAFAVTVVLAQLSMTFVERPAARLRPRVEGWVPVRRARSLPWTNPVAAVPTR